MYPSTDCSSPRNQHRQRICLLHGIRTGQTFVHNAGIQFDCDGRSDDFAQEARGIAGVCCCCAVGCCPGRSTHFVRVFDF